MEDWTIEPHGDGYALYSGRGPQRHGMNLVHLTEPDGNWEQTKMLIESLPDLLEACKDTVTYLERYADPESNELWCKVTAAVRKATG